MIPAPASIVACARDCSMSYGASRRSKAIDALSRRKIGSFGSRSATSARHDGGCAYGTLWQGPPAQWSVIVPPTFRWSDFWSAPRRAARHAVRVLVGVRLDRRRVGARRQRVEGRARVPRLVDRAGAREAGERDAVERVDVGAAAGVDRVGADLRADRARLDVGGDVRDLVVADRRLHQHRVGRRVRVRVGGHVLRVAVRVRAVPQLLDQREQQRPLELVRVARRSSASRTG